MSMFPLAQDVSKVLFRYINDGYTLMPPMTMGIK